MDGVLGVVFLSQYCQFVPANLQITLRKIMTECFSLAGHFTSCGLAIDKQAAEESSGLVLLPSLYLPAKQASAQDSSHRSPLSTDALWRSTE